ncbi:hypothetical protein TrST_g11510 [Triparma strigata]|uniref:Uncharacterized protein n=2 Tax=Triparma strigata TaxID=1606541 RepID=A0A9W7DZ99_9STRA|nr:hypothetical protein TrST_g11510 [Triparma strigata]
MALYTVEDLSKLKTELEEAKNAVSDLEKKLDKKTALHKEATENAAADLKAITEQLTEEKGSRSALATEVADLNKTTARLEGERDRLTKEKEVVLEEKMNVIKTAGENRRKLEVSVGNWKTTSENLQKKIEEMQNNSAAALLKSVKEENQGLRVSLENLETMRDQQQQVLDKMKEDKFAADQEMERLEELARENPEQTAAIHWLNATIRNLRKQIKVQGLKIVDLKEKSLEEKKTRAEVEDELRAQRNELMKDQKQANVYLEQLSDDSKRLKEVNDKFREAAHNQLEVLQEAVQTKEQHVEHYMEQNRNLENELEELRKSISGVEEDKQIEAAEFRQKQAEDREKLEELKRSLSDVGTASAKEIMKVETAKQEEIRSIQAKDRQIMEQNTAKRIQKLKAEKDEQIQQIRAEERQKWKKLQRGRLRILRTPKMKKSGRYEPKIAGRRQRNCRKLKMQMKTK